MEAQPRQVDVYVDSTGDVPFEDRMMRLTDLKAKAAIDARITRLRQSGSLGKYAHVGDGILELKINVGPGYRIYCVDDGSNTLLLYVGSKDTQKADIARAKKFWRLHKAERIANA